MVAPVKKSVHLDDWCLVTKDSNSYLMGRTTNHPLPGSNVIRTSEVIWFNYISGIAETKNTIYWLGIPNEAWLKSVTASGRILDQLSIEKHV